MSPISILKGVLQEHSPGRVVLYVGGVGFELQVPTNLLPQAGVGDTLELYTHLVLRDESAALYGFGSKEERGLFQTLIGVSGVGPRVALALLSTTPADELSHAISSGNVSVLAQAAGVGKKLASRIVLELKGKLVVEAPGMSSPDDAQVTEALVGLGYTQAEAAAAAANLKWPVGTPVEERVRTALQYFAQR